MVGRAGASTRSMVALAVWCGRLAAPDGARTISRRWELLATIAAEDVSVARVVEAHLDALAILAEAADAQHRPAEDLACLGVRDSSSWGVFAAEATGVRVDAVATRDGRWVLSGVKPWCSVAADLTHALLTAHTADGRRRLFAVALQDGTVVPTGQEWVARGLQRVPSTSIRLTDTPAVPVGPDQWYLDRPGFSWGGAGVAACWYGGAVGVARRLADAGSAKQPDQIADMHLGAVDLVLTGARCLLAGAAQQIESGRADGQDGVLMSLRVRAAAAAAAEEVVQRSAHALGPGPLALDEEHARRVADLQMYIRQHHAERDLAALGRAVRSAGAPW